MKTPEQLAEEFSQSFAGERRKTIAKKSWWTGYEAAMPQWISMKDRLPNDGDRCLVTAPEWNIVLDATWNCNDTGIFFAHEAFDEKFHKILPSDATLYWTLAPKLIKN
jgi:hypothetical protein